MAIFSKKKSPSAEHNVIDLQKQDFNTYERGSEAANIEDENNDVAHFHRLFRKNPLAEGLCLKVQSLIIKEGWRIVSDDTTLDEFYQTFQKRWKKYVLEGIIGGMICIKPEINPRDNTLVLDYIPTKKITEVKKQGDEIIEITVENDTVGVKKYSVIRNGPYNDERGRPQNGFNGEVFLFRFNETLDDKFGRSMLASGEEFICGWYKIGGYQVSRNKIMQMLSWTFENFQEDEDDAEKTKKRRNSFRTLADGVNQIIFLEEGEKITPMAPNLRNLGSNESMRQTMEAALLSFEFPAELFSAGGTLNYAALKEAANSFIGKYQDLQKDYADALEFIISWWIARRDAREQEFAIDLPQVFTLTRDQKTAGKKSEQEYLDNLQDRGVVTAEEHKEQSLRVARGQEIEL